MPTQRKLVHRKKNNKIQKTRKKQIKKESMVHTGGAEEDKEIDEDSFLLNNNLNNINNNDINDNDNGKKAKSGAYNKNKELNSSSNTGISKQLQELQSGLSLQYPGTLNKSQENALKNKLENVRNSGFPGLEIKPTEQFKPKIKYQTMYESDLLSSILAVSKDEFNNVNANKPESQTETEEME